MARAPGFSRVLQRDYFWTPTWNHAEICLISLTVFLCSGMRPRYAVFGRHHCNCLVERHDVQRPLRSPALLMNGGWRAHGRQPLAIHGNKNGAGPLAARRLSIFCAARFHRFGVIACFDWLYRAVFGSGLAIAAGLPGPPVKCESRKTPA